MNDVGESFFSSPIDPFDLSKDWGRSDDDQRHRLVLNGAVNTSMEPATTPWERLSHGFQLSGMLQYYSALPFNITSGVTTMQGTAGRPIVNGAFIARNAGDRPRLLQPRTLRREPRVHARRARAASRRSSKAFNLTNRVNVVTRERQLRSRRLSDEPVVRRSARSRRSAIREHFSSRCG